ncbi:MAG: LamG-like jellyroll fold domain-containing protein [Planctomycetota bacterium]
MDEPTRRLIYRAIDATISESEFEQLQDAIESNDEIRSEYLRAIRLTESLEEIAREPTQPQSDPHASPGIAPDAAPMNSTSTSLALPFRVNCPFAAIAASVLVIVTGTAFWLGGQNRSFRTDQVVVEPLPEDAMETQIAGHATLRRALDVLWTPGTIGPREGDVLPNGAFSFREGLAEIDFFCGATLIVEGPAELEIESDWSVGVTRGRLRATVPPAARGFIVKAAGSEIVDLGTEFAVEVGVENARVEVIDGEVELRGGDHDGRHLTTGESQALKGTTSAENIASGLSTANEMDRRRFDADQTRFLRWQSSLREIKTDERLIAFYPIAQSQEGRIVREVSRHDGDRHGLLVGPVDRVTGRFGGSSSGLSFDRPGARVRTRIDGSFNAFTFACWVRIDSLEHRYNALFMADSYQTGEPHWQIRNDGRLMFSVMVDDSQDVEFYNKREQRLVKDAGLHHVYYSDPIWDLAKSGQWFHLVAVYDPVGRRVVQYANGAEVGNETIEDPYHISSLKIGAAEIGNWGQPFRKSPWFAVRNINGTIDELSIYQAALSSEEVGELFQQGKPLGY